MSSASRRLATALAAVALVAGCSRQAELDVLGDEPLLEPPPGGVELLRTETAGRRAGFGTPARIEVVWGLPGHEAALTYLDRFEASYRLVQQGVDTRYLGRRSSGEVGVNASLQFYEDVSAVRWEALIGEVDRAEPWTGPVAVVRVSSP